MSWLDAFLTTYSTVQVLGVPFPHENVLNFTGAVVGSDDVANGRTTVNVTGGGGGGVSYTHVTGGSTVTAVANTIYVCDPTAGNITINLPTLTAGQVVGVIAGVTTAGGGAYATKSITVNAASPQVLALPPPNNVAAPAATFVIGGASATSGSGANDAGESFSWVYGGITNVLSLQ